MNNFRYSPNPDAIQEDRSMSLTWSREKECVMWDRSDHLRIYTLHMLLDLRNWLTPQRALSIMQDSRQRTHKILLEDYSLYQTDNEKLWNHSSIYELMEKITFTQSWLKYSLNRSSQTICQTLSANNGHQGSTAVNAALLEFKVHSYT